MREFADVLFEVGGLASRYQLVSYDQRGTGFSGVLRCPRLERDVRLRSTGAGADCATRLGARRGLYGTRESVEDIEALRVALGAPKLTLFGISYGTKLALAYARAHPDRVERMALDSVLDPDDADVFGLEPYRAMAPSLAALCPAGCKGVSADPGGDLARLADRLRAAPLRGAVYGMRGRRRPATLTALALSDLMFDADYNPAIRAGIPAGVRAALDNGDPAPLLRLVVAAESLSAPPGPRVFSAARYAAVCEETPLPWPRGAPFGERVARAQAEADRLGRGAFLPFAYAEARADEIDLCLRWPETAPAPAAGTGYPAVPTLVLQGGEDLRTPPAGSERVAAAIPGVPAGGRAGRRARGGRRRPHALRGAAAVRVPARELGRGAVQARADARAGDRRAAAVAGPPGARRGRPGGARAHGGGARRDARRPDLRAVARARRAAVGAGAARGDVPPAARRDRAAGPAGRSGGAGQRQAAAARQRPPADHGRPGGGRPGAGLAERRGARAARRAAGARAAAGGAAAAGRERCADRREVGAVPAQSGLFFRPTPVVASSSHRPPIRRCPASLMRSTPT